MRKVIALFCLVTLAGCLQSGDPGNGVAGTASVARFDGVWRGVFHSETTVGSNGFPCVDAEARATISSGRMQGEATTEYGTYLGVATISPDGSIAGSFELGRFVGEFTGNASGTGVFSGDFRDSENCRGTWRMRKVLSLDRNGKAIPIAG